MNQLLRVRKKSRDSSALEETLRQDQPLRPLHQLSWRQLQLGCPVLVAPIAQLMPGPIAPTLRCGTTASLAPYGPSGARQSHSGDAPHVLRCADEAESREPKPSAGWLRSSIRCQVDAGFMCSLWVWMFIPDSYPSIVFLAIFFRIFIPSLPGYSHVSFSFS